MMNGEETFLATIGALALSLDPLLGDWIVTVIVAIIAVIGTWIASRMQHRGRPEHALIDQLQEEMVVMRADVTGLKAQQNQALRRERIRDDYISKLRRHIDEGQPPPPPPWPAELSRHHDYDEE
ncbi:hypothetical protein AB0K08_13490 [Citricoccus sp. NPDC055426]|uniref:hypothetical protein n=1 Tax=Citricoccus sp. NPDC055426 TaxID=3155536 RepID=UPI00342C0493